MLRRPPAVTLLIAASFGAAYVAQSTHANAAEVPVKVTAPKVWEAASVDLPKPNTATKVPAECESSGCSFTWSMSALNESSSSKEVSVKVKVGTGPATVMDNETIAKRTSTIWGGTILLPAGATVEVQCGGESETKCVNLGSTLQVLTTEATTGKEGPAGKEGPEGKAGSPGPEGKASVGFTSEAKSELGEAVGDIETGLLIVGGILLAGIVFGIFQRSWRT